MLQVYVNIFAQLPRDERMLILKAAMQNDLAVVELVRAMLDRKPVSVRAYEVGQTLNKDHPQIAPKLISWPLMCARCIKVIKKEVTCAHCNQKGCADCVRGRGCTECEKKELEAKQAAKLKAQREELEIRARMKEASKEATKAEASHPSNK